MHPYTTIVWLGLTATASATPIILPTSGRLLQAEDSPAEGAHTLTASLYDGSAATTPLWTRTYAAVPVADGYFSLELSGGTPTLDSSLLARPEVWLGLTVDAGAEMAKTRLHSVPYAVEALSVRGGAVVLPTVNPAAACAPVGAIGTDGSRFYGCSGALRWVRFQDVRGPFRSCQAWLDDDPTLFGADGAFDLDLDADGVVDLRTWCDMTRDGGGWTLVMQGAGPTGSSMSNATWNSNARINHLALDDGLALSSLTTTAKLSDADIATIVTAGSSATTARFRADDNGGNTASDFGIWFLPQSCTYTHNVPASGGCLRWSTTPNWSGGSNGVSPGSGAQFGVSIEGSGTGFTTPAAFSTNYQSATFKKWIVDGTHNEDTTGNTINFQLWVK